MPRCTNHTCRVRFVYHYQRIVLFGQVANAVYGRHITVHREYAIGNDDAETLLLRLLQTAFKVGHVGVLVAIAFCFAESNAVDDGCMVKRIADNGVFVGEKWFEHTSVSVETGGIENGVFGLEVVRNGLLQLFMGILCATDKANRRHAKSPAVHHALCTFDKTRMVRQA